MGLKDHLSGITASIAGDQAGDATKPSSRAARTAPGQLFAFSTQAEQMRVELEELKKNAGAPRMLPRSALRPSPFQTKVISQTKVTELADNLRHNDLATPIVVREIEPGLFEVIAGHHRDLAYGELGRDEIPAVVVKMTDEQAERAVFFDNFFPPEMSDYEKYVGLAQVQRRHKYTQEALAERSGISRQLVGYLLAFDKLPEAAHKLLRANPTLLGAAVAGKLAALNPSAKAKLPEGLELIANGKLTQAKLIDWLTNKQQAAAPSQTVIKAGRSAFAKVRRRAGRLTIDFTNVADAESLESDIAALLKRSAESKR
jgi:ParB family chromosome partitioning protein